MHAYTHAYIHANIHTHIRTHTYTYVHMRTLTYTYITQNYISFTLHTNPGMHPMNWLRPNRRAFRPTNVLTPNRRARRVAARRQEEGARSGVPGLPTFKRPVALDAGTLSLAALSRRPSGTT